MSQVDIFTPLQMRNLLVKNRIFRSNISGKWDNEDGTLTQTRINWECLFAEGGVGAIISSYVPVLLSGRIIAGYATIHSDQMIPLWETLVKAVHQYECKYIMQLSHSGRQMDLPGVHNQHRPNLSSTNRSESLHGFPSQAMTLSEIDHMIDSFAKAAWRAREAGADGIELHAANGYLFTQFLSSGINDRTDNYGGSLFNRARFLLDVIQAIREKVGRDYHLQIKISAVDHNNVLPWERKGNGLDETVQICKWAESAGVDAIHVSMGSLFPHPLNPPGDFHFNTIASTYDAMLASGAGTMRNYMMFRYAHLRPIFSWIWNRMKKGRAVQGVGAQEAQAIRRAVSIPVICTGGFQSRSLVEEQLADGCYDGISIARALIANPDLPHFWKEGLDEPPSPCTHCNKCLLNAPKNPLGCYELSRFGGDHEKMLAAIERIYTVKPALKLPHDEMRRAAAVRDYTGAGQISPGQFEGFAPGSGEGP